MKKALLFFFLFFVININCILFSKTSIGNFSHTYSKFFQEDELINKDDLTKKSLVWEKDGVEPFSEMIFSWNVIRPKSGYFSFLISAKHSNWSGWYKIADWGKNKQETFVNTRSKIVHMKHVRTEINLGKKATGYRIKIVPNKGANLTDLKALFVCLSDMKKFKVKNNIDLPSTCIKGVSAQSQMVLEHPRFRDFCSPTTLAMIINYLKNDSLVLKDFIPDFADKVHDNSYLDIYGNWTLNVAQAFDSMNGKAFFRVERLNDFEHLHSYLLKKIPVAVSVRGYLRGGAKVYDNGHFILVVGWNNKNKRVLCIDPAFLCSKKALRAYGIKNFLQAWGTSRNLSYISIPV